MGNTNPAKKEIYNAREVAKNAADVTTVREIATERVDAGIKKSDKESQEAREKLKSEIALIPPYLKPTYVLGALSKESKAKMEIHVKEQKTEIEPTELRSLAQAIVSTEFRDKQAKTEADGVVFRRELTSYLEVIKTTATLSPEHQKTEKKLIEIYGGLASYHVDAEIVRGDSKGQIESLWEEVKETGWSGLHKGLDLYSDAEPFEKLAIAGVLITFALWSALSESESANNIRKTVFGVAGGVAAVTLLNWGVEKATDESLVEHADRFNATADVDSLVTYLEIKGEQAEEVAETMVDGMLFNKETRHLEANKVFAKCKYLKGSIKEDQVLDYDKENLDPALFYQGVEAFYKRVEALKATQPEVYTEVKEAIDNDAELYEVYAMVLALDPDAWQIEKYHTYVGKWYEEKWLDSEFEDYVEDDLAGFKKWFESTEMYSAKYKSSPELLTETYYKEKFGSTYKNKLELSKKFSYNNILNECLNSKVAKVDAVGRKHMAVNIKIADGETPDVYIKRAYTELKTKYKLKGEVEPVLGTIIEEPSKSYILVVRDAGIKYNPIV